VAQLPECGSFGEARSASPLINEPPRDFKLIQSSPLFYFLLLLWNACHTLFIGRATDIPDCQLHHFLLHVKLLIQVDLVEKMV
jgi:hypothetical protein